MSPSSPLPPALDADAFDLGGPAGRVQRQADARGSGPSLLRVRSVNAAGNARELGPVFEHDRGQRPVCAWTRRASACRSAANAPAPRG